METLDAIRELMNRINNTNIKIEDIESEKISPSLERLIPLLVRLKITICISLSNSWIAFVRLGCEMYNLPAASVIVPVSATVTTYFSCCNRLFGWGDCDII